MLGLRRAGGKKEVYIDKIYIVNMYVSKFQRINKTEF